MQTPDMIASLSARPSSIARNFRAQEAIAGASTDPVEASRAANEAAMLACAALKHVAQYGKIEDVRLWQARVKMWAGISSDLAAKALARR